MATRRRRNNATTTETVSAHIPDGAWDDFSAEAPEVLEVGMTPEEAKKFHDWEKSQIDNAIDIARKVGAEAPELIHEEMLKEAAEREAAAMQALNGLMEHNVEGMKRLAEIEAAEREEVAQFLEVMAEDAFSNLGEQDFFDPTPQPQHVAIPPAPTVQVPVENKPLLRSIPRYILRNDNRRRKG
jgi:hypothetical protein